MNKAIVVAKYKEDISWLDSPRLKEIKKYIYNKGSGKKGIKLDNIGREAHTYLTHIIRNYDKLDDIIIFTQGHPFDHCEDFIEKAHNIDSTDYYDFGCLNTRARISEDKITRKGALCWEFLDPKLVLNLLEEIKFKPYFDYKAKNMPVVIDISHFAIFSVGKELLLKYPIDFYQKLLDFTLQYDIDAGYVMEMLWRTLYD